MNKTYLFVFMPLLAVFSVADALEAGVGVADITPDVAAFRVPLAGYGARLGRPATGVRDPLMAKVLYLRDGAQSLALVACDLRSATPEFKEQIVRKTADLGLTPDNVLVAASHTHAGPSMYPEKFWQMQFGAYDPAVVDRMSTAVAGAIRDAAETAASARIGFSVGRAEGFTRNRRWGYNTETREAGSETPAVDPRLVVLRIDAPDGTCCALVVHFAVHPTILSDKNMRISAEWPGVLQRELEQAFPGCAALYLNGAQGDQSPVTVGADEEERMEDYGKRLAGLAAQLAASVETKPNLPIAFARATPDLPPLAFHESAQRRFAAFQEAAREALPEQAEIQLLMLGPVVLAGLPGEPILEVGTAVEERLAAEGFEMPLTVGLANDYIGYLLIEKEYAHGGYEVESRSYYGPGLGAFLVDHVGVLGRTLADTRTMANPE